MENKCPFEEASETPVDEINGDELNREVLGLPAKS